MRYAGERARPTIRTSCPESDPFSSTTHFAGLIPTTDRSTGPSEATPQHIQNNLSIGLACSSVNPERTKSCAVAMVVPHSTVPSSLGSRQATMQTGRSDATEQEQENP